MNDSIDWWEANFRIKWPENSKPLMYIDLLLAHKIISPILEKYEDNIKLWRFHRRAERDESGHLFSFDFCTSEESASNVMESIRSDPLLEDMKKRSYVEEYTCKRIGDICGDGWESALKKSWPYFIMGASQTWLHLIDEISNEESHEKGISTLEDILRFYERVNETIVNRYWRIEGCHIYLHHLNAIFGYEPMLIQFPIIFY